ncbi:ATPase, T2SS/T4P/T4SS family [Paenibacillus sp. GD4]|uniref:GspE/PulE family protein n=1 Tax=Paenibacillus sp. GD4 TaxID=3068890 RepID=UPI002796AB3C|nr:ATPase, T2SS/T4P/T4SS family [Paenibacillus sp. GD4]MDQ1911053.1 ATPase, T2SS/T4P/T4SS family [Paenibacillus sp. GD4]
MRLGELLIMNGLITKETLEQTLLQQATTPRKLGELLTLNGSITERQLVEALEFQLGVPVVNMEEAQFDEQTLQLIPGTLARKHGVMPLEVKGRKLRVVMLDPLNQEALKDIQMTTGLLVQPCLATRTEIEQAVLRHYGMQDATDLWEQLLEEAVRQTACGIYLEPQNEGAWVRFKIDRSMRTHTTLPSKLQLGLTERMKNAFALDPSERKLPQEGSLRVHVADRTVDLRLSTLPTTAGESLFVSVTDASEAIRKLSELSLSEPNLHKLEKSIRRPSGLILVSGPWGSGKTTTLYTLMEELNKETLRCASVEERVLRRLDGVQQVEVKDEVGLTAPLALRSVLRQEPNAILIDDLSSPGMLQMALRAAAGGKLIIGSVLGSSAAETLQHLLDRGTDPYLAASSLHCVVSQRMVRRVCKQCAQSVPVTDEEAAQFESHGLLHPEDGKASKGLIGNFRSFVSAQISGKPTVIRGSGCSLCQQTGYRGYVPLQEVVTSEEGLRSWMLSRRQPEELKQQLEQSGSKSLLYDGLMKARSGITTVDEVLREISSG